MKLAIMQPYLFPYIGYFQLLEAVDKLVIYDDVQFIKDGWIHRNRLLINRQDKLFTLPLEKNAHTALICERMISGARWEIERGKLLTMIRQSYGKAPCFKETFALVERCLLHPDMRLSCFVENSLVECCSFLGIETELVRSSSLNIGMELPREDRVLALCKALQADHYINAVGAQGLGLYSSDTFSARGVRLSFIKAREIVYPQFKNEFVPWLSIIDVMMFNPVSEIREYLKRFELMS